MPQLDIDIIFRSNETLKADAVQRLADAAGKVFDTPPGKTWVKINPVPPQLLGREQSNAGFLCWAGDCEHIETAGASSGSD